MCFILPFPVLATEPVEDYRIAKFKHLAALNNVRTAAENLTPIKNELLKLQLIIDRKTHISTKEMREQLNAILGSELDLVDLPEEPEDLQKLIQQYSAIEALIQEYSSQKEQQVMEQTQYELKLSDLENRASDARDKISNQEEDLRSIQKHLDSLNGAKIINDPELVSYIDRLLSDDNPMELLLTWYREHLENYLLDNDQAVVGRRGKFENVAQGVSYLLWHNESNKLYDLNSFQLSKLEYPGFKPIEVSSNLDGNAVFLDQTYNYSQAVPGKKWMSASENEFVQCTKNKAFESPDDAPNLCRILFPGSASLDIKLERETYVSGTYGYLVSAKTAQDISALLLDLNDEVRLLLSGVYPYAFVEPAQGYFENQKDIISNDMTALYVMLADLENQIFDTKSGLNINEKAQTEIEQKIALQKLQLTKVSAKLEEARNNFDREVAEITSVNEEKIRRQELQISRIEQKIAAVEEQIEEPYLGSIANIQSQLGIAQQTLEKAKQRSAKATINVNKAEQRLPDAFANAYIKKNLSSKIRFKSNIPNYNMTGCYSFRLNGQYFLTQPKSVRLAYNGEPVPDVVERHFLGKAIIWGRYEAEEIAKFENKFNESIRGITPNLAGYENREICGEFRIELYGEVARFFDKKPGNPLDDRNWSLIVDGVGLGLEDELTTSGNTKFQQATANQLLFKEEIESLKTSIEAQFNKINELNTRLINIENPVDISITQGMLVKLGYSNVLVDGAWGPNSNKSLKQAANDLGFDYETIEDLSIELQKQLIQNAFFK